jgi:prepilin peptidase CpaA
MPRNIEFVLIALVTAAAWSDLRTRKIPNWITVPGAAVGFALQIWYGGLYSGLTSLAGAGLGLGIFIVLYIVGGMGAGDVKLFSAIGALVGPQTLILVFVFTGLIGGIAAIALAISRGQFRETLERAGAVMRGTRATAGPDALRLPYGAVIAGGTLVSILVLQL